MRHQGKFDSYSGCLLLCVLCGPKFEFRAAIVRTGRTNQNFKY